MNVISATGLGKQYRLGTRAPYGALRDSLVHAVTAPARMVSSLWKRADKAMPKMLWALRDVSFEVEEGEIIGIIGRNGSGKSTLLKILSRITEPTCGEALIRGRVGSLLEVGTGFHPELTGRENVFVNGAILGMKRREIADQFDEIVAFAGVEEFIDTAVKHYSSGMQMRLAFAVAAHLQPNILLVDEVLAVGDREFQRRCLGKMKDVSLAGRTVLLVSHQMNQIRRLCRRAVWLDAGRVMHIGPVGETIRRYEHAVTASGEAVGAGRYFTRWELGDGTHVLRDPDEPFAIRVHLRLTEPVVAGHYGLGLLDDEDAVVAGWAFEPVTLPAGPHVLEVTIPQLPLQPGTYQLTFALFNRGNNLTGGVSLEKWIGVPPLTLDVNPRSHPQDEWAGVLNVPGTFAAYRAEDAQLRVRDGEPAFP